MKIAFIGRVPVRVAERLTPELSPRHDVIAFASLSEMREHEPFLRDAEVVISPVLNDELASVLDAIKLFQLPMAGLDSVRLDLLPAPVLVANTYNHETSIAEHVLMSMMVGGRRVQPADRLLRSGRWQGSWLWGELPEIQPLFGRTVLIIGTGRIGGEIAERAKAFSMRTEGVTRNPSQLTGRYDRAWSYEQLPEALSLADYIVLACPLTDETHGLIGKSAFEKMKANAHVTNIARGEVVDEEAFYEALASRKIAGAAIDVWYQYPKSPEDVRMPSKFPFHELDNVLMTPHNSGWTRHTIEGRVDDIRENIRRYTAGEPLLNLVPRG